MSTPDQAAETQAERIARRFHETYEALAPAHGYTTRKESAAPWGQVPGDNRRLMVATVQALMPELIALDCDDADLEIRKAQAEAIRAAACATHDHFADAMVPLTEVVDLLDRIADIVERGEHS